jgi:hypothetical protein
MQKSCALHSQNFSKNEHTEEAGFVLPLCSFFLVQHIIASPPERFNLQLEHFKYDITYGANAHLLKSLLLC